MPQTLARPRGTLITRLEAFPPIEPFAIPATRTDPGLCSELDGSQEHEGSLPHGRADNTISNLPQSVNDGRILTP